MDQNERQKRILMRRGFLLAMIFMGLWTAASLVNAFFPKKAMSSSERRALAQFPKVSIGRLLDGRFEEDFEEYAKDQIMARDALAALDVSASRGLGNAYASGVWIGRDGWLLEDPEIWTAEEAPSALEGVNRLAKDWGYDVTLAVIPEAAEILPQKLPWAANGAKLSKECRASWEKLLSEKLQSGVTVCDVSEVMAAASEKEDVYYHTDHHWTTQGAMSALPVIMKGLGGSAGEYKLLKVCSDFQGTLASISGVHSAEDEIWIPVAADGKAEPVIVRVEGEEGLRTSVFSMEGLQSDDPYTVFMGGNYGKFTVTTGEAGKGTLLVLKDSYFNCLLPMLLKNYSEIVVVDPRYYDGDPEMLLLSMKGAKVLVCYSRATFLTDQSLGRLVPERTEN